MVHKVEFPSSSRHLAKTTKCLCSQLAADRLAALTLTVSSEKKLSYHQVVELSQAGRTSLYAAWLLHACLWDTFVVS